MARKQADARATMTATGLLIALESRGVLVANVRGRLLIFPRQLTPDEERQLRQCRAELLELAEDHREILVTPIPSLAAWYAGLSPCRQLAFAFATHKRMIGEAVGMAEGQRKTHEALRVLWELADTWGAIGQ